MTDNRNFPYPGKSGAMIIVDLDDREPLTALEAEALNEAVEDAMHERAKLNESIRKMNQRLM